MATDGGPPRTTTTTTTYTNAPGLVTQNVADSNIFFYVMLTLVFLLAVLSIILAIVAYVKATAQLIGPQGPAGPPGEVPVAQLFEQPAFYVSAQVYNMDADPNKQPRFIVFTANPGPGLRIEVTLPPAANYNGKILRFYNVQAPAGVFLRTQSGNSAPVPTDFNPILPGYFVMAISDGGTQWVLNSSTIEFVPTSEPTS